MAREKFRLDRRAMLKGLGGVSIGLPLLEIMLDGSKAFAQAAMPPKRYVVFFNGQSTGADDDPQHNDLVPNTVGPGYDLKSALAPLGALSSEVSVISGLKIPTAHDNGGTIPAGGRSDDFHVNSLSPLLSGMRSPSGTRADGPTSDQVMVPLLAGNTPFQSVQYRVQADWYLSVSAPYGRDMISYKANTGGGNPIAIPPQVSPHQAFTSLFGNFTPPGADPAQVAAMQFDQKSRRSVLDLVLGHANTLNGKLGRADQARLAQHMDAIRQLEMQIAALPPPMTSTCMLPADPGADPSVGNPQGTDANGDNTYNVNLGYSGEEQRAKVFCDMLHMAMVCDLTRVATLQMTMFQSHLNMNALTQQATDLHEISHNGVSGGTMAVSKAIAWHVKWYAYLLQKIKDTPEANGSMLDNLAMVYLWEGGHGYDPGGGVDNSAHSTENMAAMVAGRVGGLHPGLHIPAPGMHPANVIITAMKAVGYTQNSLGEVTGEIPGLRG